MLNNFLKLFGFFVFCIGDDKKYFVRCVFSAVFIVFLHGFIEVCFAHDKTPEFGGGRVYSWEGVENYGPIAWNPNLVGWIEADKFVNNGGFEFGSGRKKLLLIQNVDGGFSAYSSTGPGACQSSNNPQSGGHVDWHKEFHVLVSAVIGWVIGMLIFLVTWNIYLFTQHHY